MSRDGDLPDREVDARFAELARSLGPLDVPHTGPRDYSVEDDAGGFEEPDPPLVPGNPAVTLGWLALLLGIAVVIATVAASWSQLAGIAGVLLAAGGLATLVFQLPKGRSPDDGDGAEV